MIRQGEIQKIASVKGLRDTQIEKDYVIGWVLYGISHQEKLKRVLAFKGGTSLRKIYFTDYRLSEDLDFTYVGNDFMTKEIIESFNDLIDWIAEESRISMSIQDEVARETGSFNFYLAYTGPLGGKGANKRIKVDISSDEIICNAPEEKNVYNEYSDISEYAIFTYTLGEIIAEKMRSIMQRSEPRDIYDLWYLFEVEKENIEERIYDFRSKAESKDLIHAEFIKTIERKEAIFKRQWGSRLASQVHELPNFDDVWRELGKHWKKYIKYE